MNQLAISSPLGNILIYYSDKGIFKISLEDNFQENLSIPQNDLGEKIKHSLETYFQGTLRRFDLPLDLNQGTSFQQAVWRDLIKIPFGSTSTYSEIAQNIGHPKAQQAVGGAIGDNPIAIIIPCHRVIGKNGNLTGFRWGLERKKQLLELEKIKINAKK